MSAIHLDHNGTTPVAPEVAESMWPYLTHHCGNPSSDSPSGRVARAAVENAREQVAALVGASPDEITFTSGGTEANNLAIRGTAAAVRRRGNVAATPRHSDVEAGVVVTSSVEHPATVEPLRLLADAGCRVEKLPVTAQGHTDLSGFPSGPVDLATMILAQNETGALQPVHEFAARAHDAGAIVHTDAAQGLGKIAVDVDDLGVDLLSLAGHKLYAPKAVGALYVRRGTPIEPLVVGAGQERGLRPGTENVAGIVGLGRAAELARGAQAEDAARMAALQDELWGRLRAAEPRLVRLSPAEGCLPNTLMLSLPGRLGRDVLAAAPGIEASTGSACHAGIDSPAATLVAMGVDEHVALGAIRLTLGRSTSAADIDTAVTELSRAFAGR